MTPPSSGRDMNIDRPLSEWHHISSFDTAKECEDGKFRMITAARKENDNRKEQLWSFSRCISSDAITFQ